MAWGAIIGAAVNIVGGALSGKGAKDAAKDDAATKKEIVRMQGNEDRRTLAYKAEVDDYYSQKNKQRRRDARAKSFAGFSARTKFKEPEGFERGFLAADEAPGVPITQAPVVTAATYKKPSLLDRLIKPSLDPLGIGPNGQRLQPRGSQLTPGSTTGETVVRERLGG